MRVLVVHNWGIGDWVMFTPVLKGLAEADRSVEIDLLLGNPAVAGLAELYAGIRLEGAAHVRKAPMRYLFEALRAGRRRRDVLIFTSGLDARKAGHLARFVRAERRISVSDPGSAGMGGLTDRLVLDRGLHRIENNLRMLDRLGLPRGDGLPFIPLEGIGTPGSAEDLSLLVHPGNDLVHPYRQWGVNRFKAVMRVLLREGWKVGVLLGPEETTLAPAFEELESSPGFSLHRAGSLDETLRLILAHRSFLNSDSGLGHIAAALGLRTVCIMGPASETFTRPVGPRVRVLVTGERLDCRPCMVPGGAFGCAERPCLETIGVDAVLEAIR